MHMHYATYVCSLCLLSEKLLIWAKQDFLLSSHSSLDITGCSWFMIKLLTSKKGWFGLRIVNTQFLNRKRPHCNRYGTLEQSLDCCVFVCPPRSCQSGPNRVGVGGWVVGEAGSGGSMFGKEATTSLVLQTVCYLGKSCHNSINIPQKIFWICVK